MQAEHRSLGVLLQDVRTRQRYLGDQEIRLGDWEGSLRSWESVLDSRAAQGIALESHLMERDVEIQDHHDALNLALTWLPTKESIRSRAREGVQGYVYRPRGEASRQLGNKTLKAEQRIRATIRRIARTQIAQRELRREAENLHERRAKRRRGSPDMPEYDAERSLERNLKMVLCAFRRSLDETQERPGDWPTVREKHL